MKIQEAIDMLVITSYSIHYTKLYEYNMIHDRSVGDLTFSSGIRIISAGNRA